MSSKTESLQNGNIHSIPNGKPLENGDSAALFHAASSDVQDCQQHVMPIAIVGMGCRLPGSSTNPGKLWDMLANGRSGWSQTPSDRFTQSSFQHPSSIVEGTFNSQGAHFLEEDISLFDAPFFNIGPTEAKAMDPQMRLQLEVAYEAIENGGISIERIAGTKTAVYVGCFSDDYSNIMLSDPESLPTHHVTGTGKAIFANRISYYFDLKGPSVALDTGCSASLVALHQACQSIRSGESEQAIVGGTNLIISPKTVMSLGNLGFLSEEGRCYSFDDRGTGYGRGEGIAAVIIKPLDAAVSAGDPIRAIIRNTAVNQDGKTPGITMPSSEAQESMIRSVYADAGLDPSETGYVEAHGTGTRVGDPIEITAIAAVLSRCRNESNPLFVGSVKANIGHLESASGIAGLFKAIVCLERGMIPPSINFERENAELKLWERHIKIATELQSWPLDSPRRASVNSFGYGGTNAHVILEAFHESAHKDPPETGRGVHPNTNGAQYHNGCPDPIAVPFTKPDSLEQLFVLSHKSKTGLSHVAKNLISYLKARQGTEDPNFMGNLAHTLNLHRTAFNWRVAVVAASANDMLDALSLPILEPRRALYEPRLCFIFTGQGAQWFAMGRELINRFSVFKDTFFLAESHLKTLGASWSLKDELLSPAETSRINSAAIAQPLCTALQLALIRLLESWNIYPTSVTGHSSGEIAAAYAIGSITFESALEIAYHRGYQASVMLEGGKLRGAMLAAGLSEDEANVFVSQVPEHKGKAVIACVNSTSSVTISGDRTAIMSLKSTLEARQIFVRKLAINTAYHSHHMAIVADSYLEALQHLPQPTAAKGVTFYSSVTGRAIDGERLDAAYWVKNMVSQVRFSQSLQSLCLGLGQDGSAVGPNWRKPAVDLILEVGPHSALAGFVKQTLATLEKTKITYSSCLSREKNGTETMLRAASSLHMAGYPVDLSAINSDGSQAQYQVLVDLPTYPWDHSISYWHESRLSLDYRMRSASRHPLLGAPCSDFNILEPSWRNIVRVSEIPWVYGHMIQSNIVYPGAGYVAMAIEASLQWSQLKGRKERISRYRLRDVNIGKPLLIPDSAEGVETTISLRPYNRSAQDSSEIWTEFRVFSYSKIESWTELCRGLITVHYDEKPSDVGEDRETRFQSANYLETINEARTHCQGATFPAQLYDTLCTLGLEYSGAFRCIEDVLVGQNQSIGHIRIPDTAKIMPKGFEHSHVLHPATLDACMQMISPSLVRDGSLQAPMVPTSIQEISVASHVPRAPGESLLVHTSTDLVGKRSSKYSLTAAAVSPHSSAVPVIEITGLLCKAISDGSGAASRFKDQHISHKIRLEPAWECPVVDGQQVKNKPSVTNGDIARNLSTPTIVLIRPAEYSTYSDSVVKALSSLLGQKVVKVSSDFLDIARAGMQGNICICLAELESGILNRFTEPEWTAMREMASSSSRVLWVTRGSGKDIAVPETGLIIGLARSAKADNEALQLVTLDLDPEQKTPIKTATIIQDLSMALFENGNGESHRDVEFVEKEGILHVPRIVEDDGLQQYLTASTTVPEPKIENFFEAQRPLKLEVETPGLLDSLRFIEDDRGSLLLDEDQLRIEPKAFGVNFRDVMISLGQLEDTSVMSSEYSGIVTEVGAGLKERFHEGDRVCAWGGSPYASSVSVKGLAAHPIPHDMTFEAAASIPIVYATVYYALVHSAKIQRGESILIHSAAGGVGQAAVMLAQHLGAVVFVTVGNIEKKELVSKNYGIPADNIFSSRNLTFVSGIRRLTAGKGVDVILNSASGESLHETWKCIANLGRFVEIGKRDILNHARLDMSIFNRNVTFASVDLGLICEHDPNLMHFMMAEIFKLLKDGAISPVKPLSIFPLSEIEGAFRLIQAGKHSGKVVLTAAADTVVKALPRSVAAARFAEDASYLIIGGLGGLGRAMCRWLARLKCKHIIVFSRSGMDGRNAHSLTAELAGLGVKLAVYACDVSNLSQLEQTFYRCGKEMPAVRGVIQAAMVLENAMINNMEFTAFHAALRPKVTGTLNLHTVLSSMPLEFFIMLSSCSGIFGNDGQANYASACTFQDAFARYRTRLGMPSRSIDLGMIESAGYVSENLESMRFLSAQGIKPVKLDEFLALLNYAISQPVHNEDDSQLIVGLTGFDQEVLPTALRNARFSHLISSARERSRQSSKASQPSSLQSSIQNATSVVDVRQIVTTAIVTQMSKILVVPEEDINPLRPVSAYGADSLAAVELRNWLASKLDASIGVMEILSGKSIELLIGNVIQKSKLILLGKDREVRDEDNDEGR